MNPFKLNVSIVFDFFFIIFEIHELELPIMN